MPAGYAFRTAACMRGGSRRPCHPSPTTCSEVEVLSITQEKWAGAGIGSGVEGRAGEDIFVLPPRFVRYAALVLGDAETDGSGRGSPYKNAAAPMWCVATRWDDRS